MIHKLNINPRAFNAIKNETKKIEIRVTKVNGFDYRDIKKGDIIEFNSNDNIMPCFVCENEHYSSIEELLTKYTLSSTDDFNEGVNSINSIPEYEEGMKITRVHAIHIMPIIKGIKLEDLALKDIAIDEYIKQREIIKSYMTSPDWLGDFDSKTLEMLLNSGSKIWTYYDKNNFVCSMMFIPADKKTLAKMGVEIDYTVVGDYGPMMVNPKYIGNGLQYQMLKVLDKYLLDNNYLYACSTVHPENIFSISNLLKDDFHFVSEKTFTRGVRNVYVKKIG